MTILNKDWENVQIKVFSRWCAKQLLARQLTFNDVTTEFSDGTKLIELLEVVGKEQIPGKWHRQPKNRYQQLENVQMGLTYITDVKKIKLIGIHADDIVDCNRKLTLGLTWSCINKFQIEDISVEEQTARNALLIWCKKNTQGYDGVAIQNFTSSWNTGLAFCALINKFRPETLDYNSLDKSNSLENSTKAFEACKKIGLYVYLDPEDIADVQPDEKSVVTQVSEFFHFFAGESKVEAMAEKLKRTIGIQREIDELKSNYAQAARAALDAMSTASNEITSQNYEKSVLGVKAKLIDVIKYTRVTRPEVVDLRAAALRLWSQLVTKCRSTSRPIPPPPEGLEPETLTTQLNQLDETATQTRQNLSAELKQVQEQIINNFDSNCQKLADKCDQISQEATSLSGPLSQQKEVLVNLTNQANQLNDDVNQLSGEHQELIDLHLNFKAKNSITSVQSEVDQVIAQLKHLTTNVDALIIGEELNSKVQNYNQLAESFVQITKDYDSRIESIQGENEAKRTTLLQLKNEIEAKQSSVSTLVPPYEELERDELQLDAEHTPNTISGLFNVLNSHIQALLSSIDSAIAAAKGLEISEEQLAEFRETFQLFDKDKNGLLEVYELNACLTSLGQNATDAECKDIVAKYTGGKVSIDFDSYVKFMLDRFSKSENAQSTAEAFRAIAQNAPIVTDEQLNKFFKPEDVEYLKTQLQPVDGGYDFQSWVQTLYA